MTPTKMSVNKRNKYMAIVALALGALSALFSVFALPALFATMMAALLLEGRARLIGGLLGGLLAIVGFTRFVVDWVAPNIVAAGRHSAEEKAVSRLREILWGQQRSFELGLVTDERGHPKAATLDELTGLIAPGGASLLRADLFVPVRPNVRSVEGYLFEVHPAPATSLDRRWLAYAWPAAGAGGGKRTFYIDSQDRICQTANEQGYSKEHAPDTLAALQKPDFDAEACGLGTDGGIWSSWKGKRPAEAQD